MTLKTATFEGFVASLKKLQHNLPKMRGGSRAVWNFSENSAVLEAPPVPRVMYCEASELYPTLNDFVVRVFFVFNFSGKEKVGQ